MPEDSENGKWAWFVRSRRFLSRCQRFATGLGLIEVTGTSVAILTDLAVQADKIDEAKAEEARQRAEARLKDKLSDEEVAYINASLARSLAQLRVKRRLRT